MSLEYDLPIHYIPEIDILLFLLPKVGVALFVGTLVGIEREYRGKLAGIKTNALICAASALFTAASLMMSDYGSATPAPSADVTRIVSQIVSGIGFIGAEQGSGFNDCCCYLDGICFRDNGWIWYFFIDNCYYDWSNFIFIVCGLYWKTIF